MMRGDKTDRVIGCGFVLVPPIVLIGLAIAAWPRWDAWACVIMAGLWLLFWMGGLVSACGASRDIDETADIETIHIGIIAAIQRGNDEARAAEQELLKCVEQHPGYERNAGVRRWKKNGGKQKYENFLKDGMELAKNG